MENRPAVFLCDGRSRYPRYLAGQFIQRGLEVILVTHCDLDGAEPAGSLQIVVGSHNWTPRAPLVARAARRALLGVERTAQALSRPGRKGAELWGPEMQVPFFTQSVVTAWSDARAALSLGPRFVLGQDVTAYGLATSLCRGVPRIMVPWGPDIYHYLEASPLASGLCAFVLRRMDFIIAASVATSGYIARRFRVPARKILPLTWGVDRGVFRRADPGTRAGVCERRGIDPEAPIILNARRFQPPWGCFTALEAFLRLAIEVPRAHFVLLGGEGSATSLRVARERIAAAELGRRFTILDGEVPLDVCREVMSVADVFVSLMGLGDLRSASVLQATACGGMPVVSDTEEYRNMERLGFRAMFVPPDSVDAVCNAVRFYLSYPALRASVRRQNDLYLSVHEDETRQMDAIVEAIGDVCFRYRVGRTRRLLPRRTR